MSGYCRARPVNAKAKAVSIQSIEGRIKHLLLRMAFFHLQAAICPNAEGAASLPPATGRRPRFAKRIRRLRIHGITRRLIDAVNSACNFQVRLGIMNMRTVVLALTRRHLFMLRRLILTGLLCLIIAAGQPKSTMAQQPSHNDTKLEEIEEIIGNFIEFVSSRKLDSAVKVLSALGTHFDNDQFKKLILSLDIMGQPFYSDKIIDRLYGKTGKDIIFKITSDNNVYFFRFILHKRVADNWVVTWFGVQTEVQAPLPRVWGHVTPE